MSILYNGSYSKYMSNVRHDISLIPSADRLQVLKFPLTGISILVTRSYKFLQNFRSQFLRLFQYLNIRNQRPGFEEGFYK